MLIIGLTGGIGSGKSAAAELFAQRGVPVLDADVMAREVVEPGMPALEEIADRFGADMLTASGHLDRRRMRGLVFGAPEKRRELEAILHPRIRRLMSERIAALHAPYCIVVIPLLVETGQRELCDRILVIDVPEPLQAERVQHRDGLSPEEIRAVLDAQATRDERLAAADDVIINDRDRSHLERQVQALHEKYLSLAAA
ncbi:MAG: dephospho-CoA kinase [Gammaproteobacteria bacterium]